jgi:hypothetical protein
LWLKGLFPSGDVDWYLYHWKLLYDVDVAGIGHFVASLWYGSTIPIVGTCIDSDHITFLFRGSEKWNCSEFQQVGLEIHSNVVQAIRICIKFGLSFPWL